MDTIESQIHTHAHTHTLLKRKKGYKGTIIGEKSRVI